MISQILGNGARAANSIGPCSSLCSCEALARAWLSAETRAREMRCLTGHGLAVERIGATTALVGLSMRAKADDNGSWRRRSAAQLPKVEVLAIISP